MSEEAPVTITVNKLIDLEQLKKDVRWNPADLTNAMVDQASLATHYGVITARASRQLDDLELMLEVYEAKVDRKVRDDHAGGASADKKLTEAQISKMVALDPKVVALKKAINEARQIEASAKTAMEAFKQRRDMLVQAGLLSREEMKGEVSINRRNEAEAARDEARKAQIRKIADAIS
jgi:hypothetical protein